MNASVGQLRAVERFAAALAAGEDRDGLAREAHSLVSSAGMLGFVALSDGCRALEEACGGTGDLEDALRGVLAARSEALAEIERLKAA